jgi:hypothetical protein
MFDKWEVNHATAGTDPVLSLFIDEPKKVIAIYSPAVHLLIQTVPSAGLSIMVDSIEYMTPKSLLKFTNKLLLLHVPPSQERDENTQVSGPDVRYSFVRWNDSAISPSRMVFLRSDSVFTAVMGAEYKIIARTIPDSIGTISGSGWYKKGDTAIFVETKIPKYAFDHWELNEIASGSGDSLLVNVTSAMNVTAVYKKLCNLTIQTYPDTIGFIRVDTSQYQSPFSGIIPSGSIVTVGVSNTQEKDITELVSGTDVRQVFTSWNDLVTANPRNITIKEDMTLIARMSVQYKLETGMTPEGFGKIEGSGWYDKGVAVFFIAPVIDKYIFSHWTVNGLIAGTQNTLGIFVNEPKKVQAVYIGGFKLIVTTVPDPNLAMKIDKVQDTTPLYCSRNAGSSITISVVSLQEKDMSANVPGTDTRYLFTQWNNGDTASSRSIIFAKDTSFSALFSREFKVLTATNPSGIAIIPGSDWHAEGDTAAFFAPKVSNFIFDHWEINGILGGIKDTLKNLINNPKTITAVYRALYNLSIGTSPINGLQVFFDSSSFSAPKTLQFPAGSTITVKVIDPVELDNDTFVSGMDTRYSFSAWNDLVNANPRNVTIEKDQILTAQMSVKYKIETEVLSIGIDPSGGSAWYDDGASISLSAPVIAKYKFDHWEISNQFYSSDSSIIFTVDKPKKIVALYKPIFNLTLRSSPDSNYNIQINGKMITLPAKIAFFDTTQITMQPSMQIQKDLSTYVSGMDAICSFVKWSDGDISNPRIITLNQDTSITAILKVSYKVETVCLPENIGSIITDVPSLSGYFPSNSSVTFSAPFKQFFTFVNWLKDGVPLAATNPISIYINKPQQIKAQYRDLIYLPDSESCIVFSNEKGSRFFYGLTSDASSPLSEKLIIPKGNYSYGGFSFTLSEEGLYKFKFPVSGYQQRIIFDTNIVALMSSISQIAIHGETDNPLSWDQLSKKALDSSLILTCGYVSNWTKYLLDELGITSRIVQGITLDNWNSIDNGHTIIELYRERLNKWVCYDLDMGNHFFLNETPMSFIELTNSLNNGLECTINTLSIPPKMDNTQSLTIYQRLFQVPMIQKNEDVYFFDAANRSIIESYSSSFKYIEKIEFFNLFYPAM